MATFSKKTIAAISGLVVAAGLTLAGDGQAGQVAKTDKFIVFADTQGACHAGATCTVELKLQALGVFHVNKEYPYKFKANDVAGVEYAGHDAGGKNIFSKRAGDFRLDPKNEKVGYLTLHFKPKKKGAVTISGTFKLSVCSTQNCMLDTKELSIPVAVR